MNVSRTVLLLAAGLAIGSASTLGRPSAEAQTEPTRLNILLFTADDLHAESLGVFGGRPKGVTPRLDRFAGESMRFERAHVNAAICAPSRAVIATGLYSHRSGAMGFMKAREDVPDVVTTFQKAGYVAGILGKVAHSTPKNSMRWDYEFDRGDLGNGRNPEIYYERSRKFFALAKERGKPFYFMVNSHDPHRPYCDPAKLLRGAAMPSRTYSPDEVTVPGFLPDLPGVRAELSQYLNSTRRLDDTFGRVLDALEESGAAARTLVVFLSDNGIAVPFAKCNAWFHSTRTPLLVRWPGVARAGTVNRDAFVSGVDFFPTFLEATGIAGPSGLDGRSMVPLLRGEAQSGRDVVFTQIDKKAGGDRVPMRCVQSARFGYIYNPFSDGRHRYRNNNEGKSMKAMQRAADAGNAAIAARIQLFRYRVPEELYDLRADPDSLVNLVDRPEHAKTLDALRAKLDAWMERTGDPMLKAFRHRTDRAVVDRVLLETYGPPKPGRRRRVK